MDYARLTEELLKCLSLLSKHGSQRQINRSVQGEHFILEYIAQNNEAAPSDISRAMRISTARVAAALNKLESSGFISRRIDRRDRRRISIEITVAGRERADQRRKDLSEAIEKRLRRLGESDAREYVRIMRRLAEPEDDEE